MIRDEEKFEGRELEIYAHGISKGVRFAEEQLQSKMAMEENGEKSDKDRIVGIVNRRVEVERLDSDTEDFYTGYVAGANAAYVVYLKNDKFTCPFHPNIGCDRSIPCDECNFNTFFKRELSDDYRSGYDLGYERCSAAWSDLIPEGLRSLDAMEDYEEDDDGWYDGNCAKEYENALNPKYRDGFKKGYNSGFADGLDDGLGDILELDEEVLDAIYDIRQQIKDIQGLALGLDEPDATTSRMVIELYGVQGKLTDLAQTIVMDNVFKYWHKKQVEEDA